MSLATFRAEDGARLAFADEGAGLPLLCLAGLTRTMGDFDYLRPHLPAGVAAVGCHGGRYAHNIGAGLGQP